MCRPIFGSCKSYANRHTFRQVVDVHRSGIIRPIISVVISLQLPYDSVQLKALALLITSIEDIAHGTSGNALLRTILVYFRVVVAGDGGLGSHSVGGNINSLHSQRAAADAWAHNPDVVLQPHRNGSPAHDSRQHRSADGQHRLCNRQMR